MPTWLKNFIFPPFMFQSVQTEDIYAWFSLHSRICNRKLYSYKISLVRLFQYISFLLQRLAQDPNYAVATAASRAIDELKKQWELEEGDSLRFVMNQNSASKETDVDNSAADDAKWGVNKIIDSNFNAMDQIIRNHHGQYVKHSYLTVRTEDQIDIGSWKKNCVVKHSKWGSSKRQRK